jgi:hypothetical protein
MNTAAPPSSLAATGRGQFAVMGMIGVAVVAAAFAWWWNYQRGRRALELYGPQAATLIRTARRVEFRQPDSSASIDISQAPGLLNARASLLNDASYDWNRSGPLAHEPQFSVRFSDENRDAVVTFDFDNQTIVTSSTKKTAALIKRTADGWKKYLERQTKTANSTPQPAEG